MEGERKNCYQKEWIIRIVQWLNQQHIPKWYYYDIVLSMHTYKNEISSKFKKKICKNKEKKTFRKTYSLQMLNKKMTRYSWKEKKEKGRIICICEVFFFSFFF